MVKLSNFLVALLLISAVATGLFTFIAGLSLEYGVSVDDTNTVFYEKTLNETTFRTSQIQNKLGNFSTDTTTTDRLGAFFGSGYDALVLSTNSLGIFDDIAKDASNKLGLPWWITVTLTTLIIIMIFISIVLAVLLKVEQ